MNYRLFKIKEGKLGQWKDWCYFLSTHKEDVLNTLKEEKVVYEASFLHGDIIVYIMQGECLPSSDSELNRLHKLNISECLEKIPSETLFEFKGN